MRHLKSQQAPLFLQSKHLIEDVLVLSPPLLCQSQVTRGSSLLTEWVLQLSALKLHPRQLQLTRFLFLKGLKFLLQLLTTLLYPTSDWRLGEGKVHHRALRSCHTCRWWRPGDEAIALPPLRSSGEFLCTVRGGWCVRTYLLEATKRTSHGGRVLYFTSLYFTSLHLCSFQK